MYEYEFSYITAKDFLAHVESERNRGPTSNIFEVALMRCLSRVQNSELGWELVFVQPMIFPVDEDSCPSIVAIFKKLSHRNSMSVLGINQPFSLPVPDSER